MKFALSNTKRNSKRGVRTIPERLKDVTRRFRSENDSSHSTHGNCLLSKAGKSMPVSVKVRNLLDEVLTANVTEVK